MRKIIVSFSIISIVIMLSVTGCMSAVNGAMPREDSIRQQLRTFLNNAGDKANNHKNIDWKLPAAETLPNEPNSVVFTLGGNQAQPVLSFDIRGNKFSIKGTEHAVNGKVIIDSLDTDLPKDNITIK
ncbi:MAG TPA: hypothetical protein VGK02_04325 [Candidatus Aquicultor sp.]|jgi:hypothetical protein